MNKNIWRLLKIITFLSILFFSYIIIVLVYGTATDYQPEKVIELTSNNVAKTAIASDSTFTFMTWNVGYGGLGKESNFFFDNNHFYISGGKMVVSPEKSVIKNIEGSAQFIKQEPVDIYLLQEVDVAANRSYYINQFEEISKKIPDYEAIFSTNYKVGYVPVPIFEPWRSYGAALSGLATYSKFKPTKSTRLQLPGSFDWPDYIFQLDRCAAVHRYDLQNGKQLIVINIHNTAYDKGGVMKKQQMDFLKGILLEEYSKGNYVVAGGDWNQCPPGFAFDSFRKTTRKNKPEFNINPAYLPADWQWVYDPKVPTNRRMKNIYDKEKTFVTLIDYFLVSPNLEVLNVEGKHLHFEYSDHQPVVMEVKIR